MTTRIVKANPRDLPLLKRNARYMKHEEFQRLVANIREDGCLTSVPLVCLDESGQYSAILSGNHRVMAAIEAGLEEIDVMLIDDMLPEQRRVAMQLAHNAIVGHDDLAILKELYEELDLDAKAYSGLDDKTLELLEKIKLDSISEASLDYRVVTLMFLPRELEHAQEVLAKAKEEAKKDPVWLAYGQDYDRYLESMDESQSTFGVKNTAVGLSLILAFWESNIGSLASVILDGEGKNDNTNWVPISAVIGTHKVPQGAAKTIIRALESMRDAGEVTGKNMWQGLELMAADYLSGCR